MLELENPKCVQLNAIPSHTWFLPYSDAQQNPPEYPCNTDRILSLNGDWRFTLNASPAGAY